MKIAVCLPSFNEAKTIGNVTQIIDRGLSEIILIYPNTQAEILNFDSNSNDQTADIFLETNTITPKQSFVVTGESGKGKNILEFCRYVIENNIDYCLTIDSDITSITPDWIKKLLEPLISHSIDYVTPIYERSRFEGSSTNHFAFPIIYALTGYKIRQPIAGDFAFTHRFAKEILENDLSSVSFIQRYGIDIFMTITAISSGCKIRQVNLNKKIHAPSFSKLEYMFPQIATAALLSFKHLNIKNYQEDFTETRSGVLPDLKFSHKEKALEMKANALRKLATLNELSWCSSGAKIEYLNTALNELPSENKMSELWTKVLTLWMHHFLHDDLDLSVAQKAGEELLPFFVLRAVNFWLWAETVDVSAVQEAIKRQAEQLRVSLI